MEDKGRFVRRMCDALAECEPERWGTLASEAVRYVSNQGGTLEFLVYDGRALDVTGDSLTAMMGALRSLITSSERTVPESVALGAIGPDARLGSGPEDDVEWRKTIVVGYTNEDIAAVLASHERPVTKANVEAFAERLDQDFDYMLDYDCLLDLDVVLAETNLPDEGAVGDEER
ncbi:hypothetical protein [Tractidigestivibacter scatoligenes]|jgi:hypothetical protein|uniref:hypothetical protein n=1 Tax=Tractidigestivibacter scatoligenes TaxID=1299998 RepID=UPI002F35674A